MFSTTSLSFNVTLYVEEVVKGKELLCLRSGYIFICVCVSQCVESEVVDRFSQPG